MNRYLLAIFFLTGSQIRRSEGAPWTKTIGSPEPCSRYCRRTPLTWISLAIVSSELSVVSPFLRHLVACFFGIITQTVPHDARRQDHVWPQKIAGAVEGAISAWG